MKKSNFQQLFPLYVVIFLGFFGYALTITLFIPMLMDKHFLLVASETSTATRVSLSGFLLAMYPLGQFLGSPIVGNLADHFGRKKILLSTLVACVLGFFGMALSIAYHQLTLLFLSSFLTGLCESNMAISQMIITDRASTSVERTKLIGYAYSACSVGYICGPLLGGISGSFLSYAAPFWITAVGVLGLIVWLWFSLEDTVTGNTATSIHWLHSLLSMRTLFNRRELVKIYLINFAIFFAIQGLYRVVPLYVVDKWNPSLHVYSSLISFASFACFIANLFILGRLAKRFATQKLLSGILLLSGLAVIFIVIPATFHWIWFTFGLTGILTVMALPTCTSWLSEQAPPEEQGQVLGNNQALLVLGEATSAALGGLIAAISISLPIILMGVILLLTSIIVKSIKNH